MEATPQPATPPNRNATSVAASPADEFAASPVIRRVAGRIAEPLPPLRPDQLHEMVQRAADVWAFPDPNSTRSFEPDAQTRHADALHDSLGIRPASGRFEPPGASCVQNVVTHARPAWDKVYFFQDPNNLGTGDPGYSVCTTEHRCSLVDISK